MRDFVYPVVVAAAKTWFKVGDVRIVMSGTEHSQFFENFRIAAGLSQGKHRGAPFNDGDFYKWLESAAAEQACTAT